MIRVSKTMSVRRIALFRHRVTILVGPIESLFAIDWLLRNFSFTNCLPAHSSRMSIRFCALKKYNKGESRNADRERERANVAAVEFKLVLGVHGGCTCSLYTLERTRLPTHFLETRTYTRGSRSWAIPKSFLQR